MSTAPRRVVLSGNSWNIIAFRTGLIRALKRQGYEVVIVAPADSAGEERVSKLGVRRLAVEINRGGLNFKEDLGLLFEYRRILRELQPIAYLGFTIKPNIYGSIAARQLGVPAIANINGLGTVFIRRGPLLALVSRLYRFALSEAAAVFFQNQDDFALFVKHRLVRPGQARLLPGSGVDLDHFAPAPMPAGPTTFLFTGRLIGDKGVREFVAAARLLLRDHGGLRFQLLGPLDPKNRSGIAAAELDQWVQEGFVDYLGETDDVQPFIERSAAVVLPSYREGMSRALLEAAAMGRPLIASDVPGCREVVEAGVNGYLCAARDAESLARCMIRLADLPADERSAMGAASRRKVEAGFNDEIVTGAYLDALGKLPRHRS